MSNQPASTSLLDLQRRMAAAVMEPLTRSQSARKRTITGIDTEQNAGEFIKPNDRLSSFERLEIYNRQYWFRLFDSFEEDFPGLLAVLGRRQFEPLMRAYIQACPSTSYTLRDLGSRLNQWLPLHRQLTAPRSTLAEDMARLEWAHIEAYDAGQLPAPTPEFLAAIDGQTRFQLQPTVRLLALTYPVDELLIAVRQSAGSSDISSNNATIQRRARAVRRIADLAPQPIWLAVHRQDLTVFYKRLDPAEFRMLTAIAASAPLDAVFAAADDATQQLDESAAAAHAQMIQQAFFTWSALGWLTPYSPAPHFL
jgi:hypothetical protein